jgi:hypothetical protein
VPIGTPVAITGTASDAGGGSVVRVEVSVDGGANYSAATGTNAWSFNWTPSAAGPAPIKSRAVDNTGNVQNPPTDIAVIVVPRPQVVTTTPVSGAIIIPTGIAPAAIFSIALDPASVNTSTVLLRDASNNPVPFTLSYAANAFRVMLVPQQQLQYEQTYTVTLKGGPGALHITSAEGAPLAADYTWSFTIRTPLPNLIWSIWKPDETPSAPTSDDQSPVELGLKFRCDTRSFITGVRFYKGSPANGGTHVGHLWLNGFLLRTVTFSNETPSGWQQAFFDIPLLIEPNMTYVVSYSAPQGNYAADPGYFESQGKDNGPLHALRNGVDGGNGLIGPIGEVPNQTSMSTNYWVDVTLSNTGGEAPQIVSTMPAPGATGVSSDVSITATFSEFLIPGSMNTLSVLLRDAADNPVPISIDYRGDFNITITPMQALKAGQAYTVILKGGEFPDHIRDLSDTPIDTYMWSFVIAPLPPPLPILVITFAARFNKFPQYYQEILRAEGLNNFNTVDIANVTESLLNQYDVAILAEMPLTPDQVTTLSNWVTEGGNLIAMRPDKKLAPLLGLHDESNVLSDAYLQVDTSRAPGAGITNQTIQYHWMADLYTNAGAAYVATIYSSPTQGTVYPAVTLRSIGTKDGQAAAFTFDLAHSIVFTREGNPNIAATDSDGIPPVRTHDYFFGGVNRPDWVNLDKVAIPQADELQRLLANMILYMNADKRPLPRFWYLPNMKKAAIIMTGEDLGTPDGTQTTFDMLNAASAPGCSVANWECYRATSWLYTNSGLTPSQALAYQNQGFEMGAHVSTNCEDYTPNTLGGFFASDLTSFAAKYAGLPAQRSNRTHCSVWTYPLIQPQVELNHGIRLDMNYYYWPPQWVQNRPGFMTGSGFPMRFTDGVGGPLNIYQAATHLTNETDATANSVNSMLDKALGPEGYYGVFGARYDYTDNFATQLLNSAMARNVSLISAEQLLTWLDGRNSSSFGNPTWNGTQLGFSITVGAGADNLFAMIPNETTGGQIHSLTINGEPVSFTVETIKGRSYAVFRATNGNVVATYAPAP